MTNSSTDQANFMSHILPVYKRAAVWDDHVCMIAQGINVPRLFHGIPSKITKNITVGSCAEGGCSPRMYRSPPVLEVDTLTLIDGTGHQYGWPHPDKVGVYTYTDWARREVWDEVGKSSLPIGLPSPGSPEHINNLYQMYRDAIDSNPQYFPAWYRKEDWSQSSKGPSLKRAYTTGNIHVQGDHVMAFHHQGWPQEAEEWRARARLWPQASVVEQVLQQGYQVIEKYTTSTRGIEGPAEFHITFTPSERYLAKQRTPVQKLVYLMAKTLFYTYLDLHDDDTPIIEFPSYALKTCMMWLMEQTPVDRWTEENVLCLLTQLLSNLWMSVDNGTLSNYFMIGANVLFNCTTNLLEKVSKQLACILSNLNIYLQDTQLYKGNVILYGYHLMKGGYQAYDDLVTRCQNQVLLGLLQAIVNVHKVRSTYQRIIEILEQGTGEGLRAKGYLFNEEECFHVLKAMMSLYSCAYMTNEHMHNSTMLQLAKKVHTTLGRHPLMLTDLIEEVLCLDQHLPEPEVTIIRLHAQWQESLLVDVESTVGCGNRVKEVDSLLNDSFLLKLKIFQGILCLPGERDIIVIREGQDINVYRLSDIGDLIEHSVRDLQDNENDRWMPKIYSLTNKDIPEIQLMDFARMLYLLYVCDDKKTSE